MKFPFQLWRALAACALALAGSVQVFAASCPTPPLRGINLVPLPTGWYKGAVELQFPSDSHISYYKDVGLNAIRLPIVWETIQPTPNGELNLRYLQHIIEFLDKARAQNMKVVIDLHNYGRYRNVVVGNAAIPASAFEDLWKRLATIFVHRPEIYAYGLMNEPHDTGGLWHVVAQHGVDGVRSVDRLRPIYVAGDSWSNSQRWPIVNPAPFVTDPVNQIVYEAHIYFDNDFSGTYKTPIGTTDLTARTVERLQPFLNWLTRYGQRGVIGETGVPMTDPRWLVALQKFLDMSDAACLDWFLWAGGRWRETYELSHEPIAGVDRPQIAMLRTWLSRRPK